MKKCIQADHEVNSEHFFTYCGKNLTEFNVFLHACKWKRITGPSEPLMCATAYFYSIVEQFRSKFEWMVPWGSGLVTAITSFTAPALPDSIPAFAFQFFFFTNRITSKGKKVWTAIKSRSNFCVLRDAHQRADMHNCFFKLLNTNFWDLL